MVLYFTGTGNSKFAAQCLGEYLNDEVISLNEIIKNNYELKFTSEKPYIIVAPIYSWRFPRLIENILKKAKFLGNNSIYCIGTMASQAGNCYKYLNKILTNKNMDYKGFIGIEMPDNYVEYDNMPSSEEINSCLNSAIIKLTKVSKVILENKKFKSDTQTTMPQIKSGLINACFYAFMVNSNGYKVSEDCISCNMCEKLCPVNNITMENGRPKFGAKCISCFACIQHCPKQAINIRNKTQDHGRYVCPSYNEWKNTANIENKNV